jgi:nicotinamide-nucleotide amidase
MSSAALASKAAEVLDSCRKVGLKVVTVESCTGGLIAAVLTEIAGSSDVVERGFVTYSNEAKTEQVGVPADLIAKHGAVSEEVARAMAAGGLARSRADIAVSVTGIAGPGGATATKPVGLVHLACARRGGAVLHERHEFPGDRAAVRAASVEVALRLILERSLVL